MKALTFVWGFVAFTILGLDFLSKTDTFDALQDFESNFSIVDYPEEFLPNWSANAVRSNSSRVFQAAGEGYDGSHALGIQAIGSFNAEIYIKTTTKGLTNNRFSLKAKTKRNGSGNRPASVYFSFSINGTDFDSRQQIGDDQTFANEDGEYKSFEGNIPEAYLEKELITIKMEVNYGEGSGSAARLYIDDFLIHGLLDDPSPKHLQVHAISSDAANLLAVQFNQPILLKDNQVPLLDHGYGTPKKVSVDVDMLLLEYDDYIYSNRYQLQLSNITSVETEEIWSDTTLYFELVKPIPLGALIINEIMPDPNPKGLIPEEPILPQGSSHEYIEIYNATNKAIWLNGVSYNDGGLEEVTLEPQSYLLISSLNNKTIFSSFGHTAAAVPFRTLANTSGEVFIKDAFENVIDSLPYTQDLFDHPQKRNGGWSLERVSPRLHCNDTDNWKASIAKQGGTPGRINSVFNANPVIPPLEIIGIQSRGLQSIQISFSKAIPEQNRADAAFLCDDDVLSAVWIDASHVLLTFPAELTHGAIYNLDIYDLYDCAGSLLAQRSYDFLYDIEGPKVTRIASLAPDELLIMLDETAIGPTAVSPSNYTINNRDDLIKSASLPDSSIIHLILQQPLELNRQHRLTIKALTDSQGNHTSSFEANFWMDDQLDTVQWTGTNRLTLYFHIDLDEAAASKPANYFLDKGIGPAQHAFVDTDNNRLVHVIFDQNIPVNTHVTLTTQNLQDTAGNYINSHKKAIFIDNRPIAISKLQVLNDSSVHILFNKPLQKELATLSLNYIINQEVGHPKAVQLVKADAVILTVHPLREGQEYALTVSGLQDIFGFSMSRNLNFSFFFDNSGPVLVETIIFTPYNLKFKFNEPIHLPQPAQILINGQAAAEVSLIDKDELLAVTSEELTQEVIQVLISNLSDHQGNSTGTTSSDLNNAIAKLSMATILQQDLIQLTFNHRLNPEEAIDPKHYSINGKAPGKATLLENEFEVVLSLDSTMPLLESSQVEILPIRSLSNKPGEKISLKLWYDDQIEGVYPINAHLIQVVYKEALDTATFDKNAFSISGQHHQIEVIRNNSDPFSLQLVLNPPLIADQEYELVLPHMKSSDGTFIPGSIRTFLYDKSPPQLVGIEALSETEILLTFNEALDPILSVVTSFYHLDEDVEPAEVILVEQDNQVILVFGQPMIYDEQYILTVSGLEDLQRNAIREIALAFRFEGPVSPGYRELVINEIMAAPKEGQDLPNVEYVELINLGNRMISLANLTFSNSRSQTVIPRATLPPGELVLLTASSNKDVLEKFGFTLGLSNWPTLLNGGDELWLMDQHGKVVDHIQYTNASYGDAETAQGGYSLELINPYNNCADEHNLRPSKHPSRGTPGQPNSIFDDSPDMTAPKLLEALLEDEKTLVLKFSKKLHDELDQVTIHITPQLVTSSITLEGSNLDHMVLSFADPVSSNLPYQISIQNLRDCAGNQIDPSAREANFILPSPAEEGDILLNEILFNPRTGFPKFVELYNQSNRYIDLQGWKLANIANEEIANRRIVADKPLLLGPFSFKVFTTDSQLLKQAYPSGKEETFVELSALPSYPQTRGTVILLNPEETLMERFNYDEKFHHPLLNEVRGVSLERLMARQETNRKENWQSASAASGYATPGYKNSQSQQEGILEAGITIKPEVFVPDAPGEQTFTTISYSMDRPGFVGTLHIYNIAGQIVREVCQNDVWGSAGFYTWDGTDSAGRKVRPGYYILWAQVLNLDGQMEQVKKAVVVGTKF